MKHSTIGINILRHLANHGLKIFTIHQAREAAQKLHGNPKYVTEVLYHLVKGGWITRVKRGVYAFSLDSGFTNPPHEFAIAMALASPCAISHWTAMHYHHLTQQPPNVVYATVPDPVSIPRSIDKKLYHFIRIKHVYYFGIEKIWIEETQIHMTDPERTLLDGLMFPEYCGDFQEVLHAFKMRGDQLNLDRIIEYALKLDQATAKRLGWVLETLGRKDTDLYPLLEIPIKGYRKLNPIGPLKGSYNKKWMLQENHLIY